MECGYCPGCPGPQKCNFCNEFAEVWAEILAHEKNKPQPAQWLHSSASASAQRPQSPKKAAFKVKLKTSFWAIDLTGQVNEQQEKHAHSPSPGDPTRQVNNKSTPTTPDATSPKAQIAGDPKGQASGGFDARAQGFKVPEGDG